MHGQADLLEIVGALRACGCFPHLLHRRKNEPDKYRNNRHDYQELNEREPAAPLAERGTKREHHRPPSGLAVADHCTFNPLARQKKCSGTSRKANTKPWAFPVYPMAV